MILEIIKTNPDWFQATWKEDNIQVYCESFGGSDEYVQLFRNKCLEFKTKTTKEDEKIITEVQNAFVPISQEELDKQKEENRILCINSKASEIILSKYPLYKQNNITLLLTPYTEIDLEEMKMFIDTVRNIAKQAKENGTAYEDVNWRGLD